VVTLSPSDTEQALELLFPSLTHDSISRISEPSSSSGSDQFKDWPKANETMVSAYVALTVDASSSCTSIVNASLGN
jgi:hypothetical protein